MWSVSPAMRSMCVAAAFSRIYTDTAG